MRKLFWLFILLTALPASAQETSVDELTAEELAVVQAIKAQNRTPDETPVQQSRPAAPMQAPKTAGTQETPDGDIKLSEQTKQQAWDEQQSAQQNARQDWATQTEEMSPQSASTATAEDEEPLSPEEREKCLTVAFIDIDIAFNEHPRTQAVKKQIDVKIRAKEHEVQSAREIIAALEAENDMLSRQLAALKPFYERIVTDQELLPKVPESADGLDLSNTLNRLTFSGCEMLSTSPLNSPARLDDITERIGANKKIIAERNFFIDNYKYQTREEILNLEKEEVKNILQDIYTEIKSFAQKRDIGAVVRKDDILYGQQPVNVTKDFVSTLKKSKKYRKQK